jgi:ribosomal-protein-alanine N-acetyltransferase
MTGEKRLTIRQMREEDIDEVYSIEEDLFPMPWPRRSFVFEVSNRSTTYAIVAVEGEVIIGYAIGWFVTDELHIGNVAVRRDRQGTGVGRELLEDFLREASTREASCVTLEVRASNVKAIGLYRRYGFKGIAIRRGYYTDNGEDAMVMLAELGKETKEDGPQATA